MEIQLDVGKAPKTTALAQEISAMRSGCVGCEDCRGLCHELIEAVYLPGVVLGTRRDT